MHDKWNIVDMYVCSCLGLRAAVFVEPERSCDSAFNVQFHTSGVAWNLSLNLSLATIPETKNGHFSQLFQCFD